MVSGVIAIISDLTLKIECSLNGFTSDTTPVDHGVPQGFRLGSPWFNLFVDNLSSAIDAHTVLLANEAAFVIATLSL